MNLLIIGVKEKVKKIKECIAFFSYFKRALKINEIEELTGHSVKNAELGFCKQSESHYWMGEEKILSLRKIQDEISAKYLKRALKGAKWLRIIPFIKLIAVCNTVAFKSARSNSDIDLFIITDKNRIFTARILSTLLIHLIGMRRHRNKIIGRLCLSFYLSENRLNVGDIRIENDIYMHYWMKTLLPVYERNNMYCKFMNENSWINVSTKKKDLMKDEFLFKFFRFPLWLILITPIGGFIERILKKWHLRRFENNKVVLKEDSDIRISEEMLKFHNHDKRKEIREGVERIMNSF
ncbi:hypothetical protein GF340_01135 [Candidatus Peregrinibacteria bacterium]|nr:hypothetical protein [Candidatus Peregrinibacteria bacterium]